jgi:hypothetical protein
MAKRRQTAQEKAIDKQIEAAYYRHGQGAMINVMSIPEIFQQSREALVAGQNLDDVMVNLVARFRVQ